MQNPFRETQALLHPGKPCSKPTPLKGGKGYSVTWTVSSLQIYALFRSGYANEGFVFLPLNAWLLCWLQITNHEGFFMSFHTAT